MSCRLVFIETPSALLQRYLIRVKDSANKLLFSNSAIGRDETEGAKARVQNRGPQYNTFGTMIVLTTPFGTTSKVKSFS